MSNVITQISFVAFAIFNALMLTLITMWALIEMLDFYGV